MNVVVIGLGSMGKRRIRLMKQLNTVENIYGVDFSEERRIQVSEQFGLETFSSLEDALSTHAVDCVFVCTSPVSHGKIINHCLKNGLNVFTEINLINDYYQENVSLAKENNNVLFLSSTFLYREEIKYIFSQVHDYANALNYSYHVGQYLPDWHPWESYKQFFVGDKRTNGCREIMAIELPWIVQVFGPIKSITSLHDRSSSLEIDYDDNYVIQIEHENGHKGTFHVDVVCPKAVRNLEIYGEHFYISWNGTPEGLQKFEQGKMKKIDLYTEYEHLQGYQATIVENAYQEEIATFFSAVEKNENTAYGFEDDEKVLSWIDKMEA